MKIKNLLSKLTTLQIILIIIATMILLGLFIFLWSNSPILISFLILTMAGGFFWIILGDRLLPWFSSIKSFFARKKREKEKPESEGSDKTQEDSSSSSPSVLRLIFNGLGKLIWFAMIIVLILFAGKIVYETVNTIRDLSPAVNRIQEKDKILIQEEDEWEYSQIRDSSKKIEYGSMGDEFKVREFRHNPGEELDFKVYWGNDYGEFRSDIDSSETGTYHNLANDEEGRFEVLEWDGTDFSGRMICQKKCKSKGYTFALKKK